MVKTERHNPGKLAPTERINTFDEVVGTFDAATAVAEARRCLNCKVAPCKTGCPAGVRIPEFIAEIARGDPSAALKIIRAASGLPAVCGRVCSQDEQCEKRCVRGRAGGAVNIGALERYAAEAGDTDARAARRTRRRAPRGRVAAVGSGPASLSCAADCAAAGLSVTIYEAAGEAGGVLAYGIPEFRLPKRIVRAEVEKLRDAGVKFVFNTVAGRDVSWSELTEKYDAVFIGAGAARPRPLNIPGEDLPGVYTAGEYLSRVTLSARKNTPPPSAREVAVIGGGNVAMDAARTALRLGAEKVRVVYRRGPDEMPANGDEAENAEEEGVSFEFLAVPARIEAGADGRAAALKCVRCALGEAGADGRRKSSPVEGGDFVIPCDLVVVAAGTLPDPAVAAGLPGLGLGKDGALEADADAATAIPGIFAGGDAVTGAATVIGAMGAGKRAAAAIIKYAGEKLKRRVK